MKRPSPSPPSTATSPPCSSSSTRVPIPPSPLASIRPSTEPSPRAATTSPLSSAPPSPSPSRPRTLLKARALLDAALAIPEARKDAADKGEPQAVQQQQQEAIAAAPAYLKGRVAEGQELPVAVEVVVDDGHGRDNDEEEAVLVACLKYALGLEGGTDFAEGCGDHTAPQGMVRDVCIDLCELLVPTWGRANV